MSESVITDRLDEGDRMLLSNAAAQLELSQARVDIDAAVRRAVNAAGQLSGTESRGFTGEVGRLKDVIAHCGRAASVATYDLTACAAALALDADWAPSPTGGVKAIVLGPGAARFTITTDDAVVVLPVQASGAGEAVARVVADQLDKAGEGAILDADGIRPLGRAFLTALHDRLGRVVPTGPGLAKQCFGERLAMLDRAVRCPGLLPFRAAVAGKGDEARAGRELWAIIEVALGHTGADGGKPPRIIVDLTDLAGWPPAIRRFADRLGRRAKGHGDADRLTVIDPTGLVARHMASIKAA